MSKRLMLLLSLFLAVSCGTARQAQRESTIYHFEERIQWHDSVIYVEVPVERIHDVVPTYDTLRLETSIARSVAYVDTTDHVIVGDLENKEGAVIDADILWKDRYVYRDSIITKEIPEEVEKEVVKEVIPKSYWVFMAISLCTLVYFLLKIYLKFKLK